jgi:non-ribosomal peptide synthetase component F
LPDLELPVDRPRPANPSWRGGRHSSLLPRSLAEALRALSRREGVTLFMTLLAAWLTLLHRLSGQDDFAVGADSTNRGRVETEGLIGIFVNMIVLRTDLAGNPSFRDLLARVRETCLGAFAHQDLPFERLVEELRPQRGGGHSPLFRAVFNFNGDPRLEEGGPVEMAGLTASPLSLGDEVIRFDLTLHVHDGPGGLRASWTYSRDLFDDATVARLHRRFETLLDAVLASPEARLHHLEIRDPGELEEEAGRRQALEEAQRSKLRSLRGRRGGGMGAGAAG